MTWRRAASLEELRLARPWVPLTLEGVGLALASVNGAVYAVEDRCTHAGCEFSQDATLEGLDIVCSCHGSEFDIRTGAVRRGPAERPIRTFPVRIAGDGVEVEL